MSLVPFRAQQLMISARYAALGGLDEARLTAAVDRARKLREELDEGSPRLAAPTYAPGNGTPFRAPGANGHANGANGFSESDLALL